MFRPVRAPPLFLLILLEISRVITAEETVVYRTVPLDVYSLPYTDGRARITVDWGSQGETLRRSAQEVQNQYDQLLAWLRSDEVKKIVSQEQARLEPIEADMGRQQARDVKERYRTQPQDPNTPRGVLVNERMIPVPTWVAGIPWDARRTLVIGAFDARDDAQVRWALGIRESLPLAILFAVGWKSQADLEKIMTDHPSLKAGCIVDVPDHRPIAGWLSEYQVRTIPALIRFPTSEQMLLTEGTP